MSYSVFNQTPNKSTKENLFFGQSVNVLRFDQQRYKFFDKLLDTQTGFFWQPQEVDVSKDRIDFMGLSEHEKHIFLSNLKYQTLLDSIQSRGPSTVLLPLVSVPELEAWIFAWSFFEGIHAKSYTHIIRNILPDPTVVFDDIVINENILARATELSKYYDDLYNATIEYQVNGENSKVTLYELKKKLYLCLIAINCLEGVRFYVSFACSFNFAERKLMEGNAKIIGLISRDEATHLAGTQQMINILRSCNDDIEMGTISLECYEEAIEIYRSAAEQEKDWAKYLFKDGSMVGLNEVILCQYVEYITNQRAKTIGLPEIFPGANNNPIPWINSWLSSDSVQKAPQETEITSYLVGAIDSNLGDNDFDDFEL